MQTFKIDTSRLIQTRSAMKKNSSVKCVRVLTSHVMDIDITRSHHFRASEHINDSMIQLVFRYQSQSLQGHLMDYYYWTHQLCGYNFSLTLPLRLFNCRPIRQYQFPASRGETRALDWNQQPAPRIRNES